MVVIHVVVVVHITVFRRLHAVCAVIDVMIVRMVAVIHFRMVDRGAAVLAHVVTAVVVLILAHVMTAMVMRILLGCFLIAMIMLRMIVLAGFCRLLRMDVRTQGKKTGKQESDSRCLNHY